MKIDTVYEGGVSPSLREQLDGLRRNARKAYASFWTRIDAGETVEFPHNLREIPMNVDVLAATDSQGSGQTEPTSLTVLKTDKIVSVTNGGTPLFFRVRAS